MRCALVLCLAALVGLSTAGWQYGGARYSGQQMPVRYYLSSSMNSGQQMYVPGHQQMYVPGHQQMYVPGHQQVYVPGYYQPQVAAPYPVRQTPAYQARPMVVSPQVEEVPIINVDMDFSPTLTYPGAVHGDSSQSSFTSRSGSVSSTDSCRADKLKTQAAVRANVKLLMNILNANLTSSEMENIFGQEFQALSKSGCNFWKVL